MMLNQGGTVSVAAGNFLVPEASLTVGSNTRAASTFLVDATNDWTKHLPITAPAATECDAAVEKGRMYYDDTANEFKYCNGTAWTSFGGGGGGGAGGNVTNTLDRYTLANCQNDANDFYDDGTIRLTWNQPSEKLELERLTAPASYHVQSVCETKGGYTSSYYKETDITSATAVDIAPTNGPTPGEIMTCTVAAEYDANYPSYNITFYNVGDGSGFYMNCVVKIEKQVP